MATFRRMMRTFLQGHWTALLVSLLLAIATTGLGLAVPWIIRATVDKALVGGRSDLLLPLALAILGAAGLRMVAAVGRRVVSGRVSLDVETEMRDRLFSHLTTLGFDFYMRSQTGQLMSRAIADVRAVRMFLAYGLVFLITNSITLLSVTAILFFLQPRLAALSLLPMPLILVAARAFSRRLHPSLWAVQQRIAELTAVAEERITGIRVIKAFAVEDQQQATFALASDQIYRQNLEAAGIRSRYIPLIGVLPSLSLIVILLYGGRMVVAGDLSLGSLIAFNAYVMLLIWPMRMLGMLVSWAERAIAAGERVLEVLDEQPTVTDRPGARELGRIDGAIEFRDVSFAHDGAPVIAGISLRIEPGETIAFVGPTGCGKTTLAHLIPRFYDPTEGAVLVDGVDLRDATLVSLRRQIGLVDQDPFLFSLSVRDNIRYGRPETSDERVVAAATAAAAEDFILALPAGYDTVIGERGVTLSGGQRQRLALARALLIDPRILILDDATSSVDAETEARIVDALSGLRGSHTTVIVAHRPSTVMLADRVVLMEAGTIRQVGTPIDVPWQEILVADAEVGLQRQLAAAHRAAADLEAGRAVAARLGAAGTGLTT
jgi:ABC-type multidrug transport system fused ATPase/permease subunit